MPTSVLIFGLATLLTACASPSHQERDSRNAPHDVPALVRLGQITEIPSTVTAALASFEASWPSSSCTTDRQLLGSWMNIEGYSIEKYSITYESDCGIKRSNVAGESRYTTVSDAGVNWVISLTRYPGYFGRGVQVYYIENDTLYMRFIRFDSEWEIWKRVEASLK